VLAGFDVSDRLTPGLEESDEADGALPRLSDEQLERLREVGEVRPVQPNEHLIRVGDTNYDFFVVTSGRVEVVQGNGDRQRPIAVFHSRRFLGELNFLTGSRANLPSVVREEGEVIQVPAATLRQIVKDDERLANVILTAFLVRRSFLIETGAGVKVIGSRYSPDARRLREFLARNRMPHQWMDLEEDAEADTFLRALSVAPAETPVVVSGDTVLRNPSNAKLAAMLGLSARGLPPALCDLVIVGGGPAGLAAAVYAASEGLDTQAIDAVAFGGQAGTSSRIHNYLGFPGGITGNELAERAKLQAAKFGTRLVVPAEAVALTRDNGHCVIELSSGETVNGRTVIIATGAQYHRLGVPNIGAYEGVGVHYAATEAEAQQCSQAPVVIVGGGNSAGQAAVFLSRRTASCHLLIRGDDLGKSMSRYLVAEIERREISVMTQSEIVELKGGSALEGVVVCDTITGERRELEAKAVFVFIGASPHTYWLGDQVTTDDHGFLVTGRDVKAGDLAAYGEERPFLLETSQPGVFAVGDVRAGSTKKVASAVGEGAMAIQLVHARLATW
jgi:thioredoxin reductase (NADPH)